MTPRLRAILLGIGFVTFLAVLLLLLPRGLSLYYQIKGGQLMEATLRSLEDLPDLGVTCDPIPREKKSAQGNVKQAAELLQRALAYNSQNAQAVYYLGQANCLLGQPDKARDFYIKYTQLRPKNPLGHMGFGFSSEALGDQVSALQGWQAAGLTAEEFYQAGQENYRRQNYEQALRWYQRSTRVGPRRVEAWLALGQTYEQLEKPHEAAEAYREAWKIDPETSALALANSLRKLGDYQAMEGVLQKVLAEYSSSTHRLEWWYALGDSLRSQRKWEQLIRNYKSAIGEFPSEGNLLIALGWGYYERGDGFEAAQQAFEKAIELGDPPGEAHFAMARLLNREKRYAQAEDYFLAALQRASSNRSFHLARADNMRSAGKLDRAIELYNETVGRFPDYAQAYYQLALAYRLGGFKQKAIDAIEKALELADNPLDIYYARAGDIYRWAGLTDNAVRAYRQALVLNPQNSTALRGLESLGEE